MKPKLILGLVLVLSGGLFGCKMAEHSDEPTIYHSTKYNFTFSLPASWRGYSVLIGQWQGKTYFPATDKTAEVEHGPTITLRNPHWAAGNPYQDIPIAVFTRIQWDGYHHGKFSPYVGGIAEELWHNDKYVFAIHSRYNANDGVNGWKEVEDIITQNRAVHPEPALYPE